VGVFAKIENGKMKMRAQVFLGESAAPREAAAEGTLADRECLVLDLLNRLRA
jgi:hypothetical protein